MQVGDIVERAWGFYKILDIGDGYLVKQLVIKPYRKTSYQKHNYRAEQWTIVYGDARVILSSKDFENDKRIYEVDLKCHDSIHIDKRQKHQIIANDQGCTIIEVWLGDSTEEDIERFPDQTISPF